MVRVEYSNSPRDLVAFTIYSWFHEWQQTVGLVFFVVATSIPTWNAVSQTDVPVGFAIFIGTAIEALLLGAILLLMLLLVVVLAYFSRDRAFYTNHVVTADHEGVTEETPFNLSTYRWDGIDRIRRTRRHLFIFLGPMKAHVIPRRHVPDVAEWDRVYRSLLELKAAARA